MRDSRDPNQQFYAEVWPYAATVLRMARCLTDDVNEADDLVQETMLKAFRSLDRFRPGTNMKAWLMTILRNSRIDRLRAGAAWRSNISMGDLGGDLESPAADNDANFDDVWRNPQLILQEFSDQQMIEALQELPEEIRWTLLLVDVESMDHIDAAKVLRVPVGTIKSRAHRGRAMLRKTLAPAKTMAI